MTDEQLKRYLGAVEKVRAARDETLDAAMRRQIAEELGLSPDDLAAALAAGEAALARGEGFLARGLWDESIGNLNEADALLPDDVRVAQALARASWGRYCRRHAEADRVRALAECRRCLKFDPRHQGAFALIAEIEARRRETRGKRGVIAASLLLGLSGAGAGVYLAASRPARPLCPDGGAYCTITVPLRAGEFDDGVELGPARLQISRRDLRLDVSGRLTHRGATELGLMRLDVRLLDAAGRELGRKSMDAQPSFAPPLRPGDTHTFYLSEVVPAGTRSVAVSAAERHSEPAAAAYGAGQPVPVSFEPAAPSHIRVRAAYRERSARHYDGKTVVEGVLEVENSGQGVLRSLEIQLQGLDAGGRLVGASAKETVAYPIMPPMLPGERRLVKAFLYVTGDVASEKLIVSSVQ